MVQFAVRSSVVHEKITLGAIQFHRLWKCHEGLYGKSTHENSYLRKKVRIHFFTHTDKQRNTHTWNRALKHLKMSDLLYTFLVTYQKAEIPFLQICD